MDALFRWKMRVWWSRIVNSIRIAAGAPFVSLTGRAFFSAGTPGRLTSSVYATDSSYGYGPIRVIGPVSLKSTY